MTDEHNMARKNRITDSPPSATPDFFQGENHQYNNIREKQFFDILKNLFIGVPVEGESGYINLMRIKARYFEEVLLPHLQAEIADALQSFPDFQIELFDRLYTFFRRYFTENGSIGFFFTPYHQSIYEQIYSPEQDVTLFWKTSRLYYVKTDRLFQNLTVVVDGFRFHFDVSQLQHKQANEKREVIHMFQARRPDGTLVFTVHYSEKGRQTRVDDIRRTIRDTLGLSRSTDGVPSEATLQKAFRLFKRQSEVDYFICKDARNFLCEQFDLWMWQYLLGKPGEKPQARWTEARLAQLQALKHIAYHVIELIAVFEDELVKIWNKPKFVLNSHYVITLDRIAKQAGGMEILEKMLVHPGLSEQVQEWRQLGLVDNEFRSDHLWCKNLLDGKYLHPRYQYLPVDTRHFPDLELHVITLFDNLDKNLDGWLVKSENYQALNTLLKKFHGKVKCIYIDPPYNTGSDDFIYMDHFQHSSWMTMMENRLCLAREFLSGEGFLAVSIGEEEIHRAKLLLEQIFSPSNYRNTLMLRRYDKNINRQFMDTGLKSLNVGVEYILVFSRSGTAALQPVFRDSRTGPRVKGYWKGFWNSADRPTMRYEILGVTPKTGQWKWKKEEAMQALKKYQEYTERYADKMTLEQFWESTGCSARFLRRNPSGKGMSQGIEHWIPPSSGVLRNSNWTDLMASETLSILGLEFPTAKNRQSVMALLTLCGVSDEHIVLDFFAGSGSTAHAVIDLNRTDHGKRKYLLVEMAEHFHSVILPRIKKAIFSDKWKDGVAQPAGKGMSHFVKYYELEQFEDTIRRTHYDGNTLFAPPEHENPFQYIFLRDLKMLETLEMNTGQSAVRLSLGNLYKGIDLVETLSLLTGKYIRKIRFTDEEQKKISEVIFEDNTTLNLKKLEFSLIKPLIFWR